MSCQSKIVSAQQIWRLWFGNTRFIARSAKSLGENLKYDGFAEVTRRIVSKNYSTNFQQITKYPMVKMLNCKCGFVTRFIAFFSLSLSMKVTSASILLRCLFGWPVSVQFGLLRRPLHNDVLFCVFICGFIADTRFRCCGGKKSKPSDGFHLI